MLLAGAKRHAKEILQIVNTCYSDEQICLFDDISEDIYNKLYCKYEVIRSIEAANKYFKCVSPNFVLAIGSPYKRKLLANKLSLIGGELISVIAKSAFIGTHNTIIAPGLNIMHNTMISNDVVIGTGSLINAYASIHHDVSIGEFCEISPHATILGGANIGNFTSVGANATILPDINVGDNVIIGAGAVVVTNIPKNCTVVGVPAKIIKNL